MRIFRRTHLGLAAPFARAGIDSGSGATDYLGEKANDYFRRRYHLLGSERGTAAICRRVRNSSDRDASRKRGAELESSDERRSDWVERFYGRQSIGPEGGSDYQAGAETNRFHDGLQIRVPKSIRTIYWNQCCTDGCA